MALLTEAAIDAYLANFKEEGTAATIPPVVQGEKPIIPEEKPTLLPFAPLPKRETIAFNFFEGRVRTARVVRKWVLEKAKKCLLMEIGMMP